MEPPTSATQLASARPILAAATAIVLGLALVGSSHPDLGGALVLAGWLVMAATIHRFGRSAAR